MRKFLIKIALFFLPLFIAFVLTAGFYSTDKGDLLRMGYVADIYKNYRKQFENQFKQVVLFDKVSDVFLKKSKNSPRKKYDIFTIGDSFSEQEAIGYQNELANLGGLKILHYDGHLRKSDPINELYALIRGGFFDSFQPKTVLLESVERGIGWRSFDSITLPKPISWGDLTERQRIYDSIQPLLSNPFHFDRLVRFPMVNLLYLVHDKAIFSQVYKVKTDRSYFSCGKNQLLFYEEDLSLRRANNDTSRIAKLNQSLNTIAAELKSRGIDFYFMVAPNKYTVYYNRIQGKYPLPPFFESFEKEKKNYRFIRLDWKLQQNLDLVKDIYFYDDTHWSPAGVKIVSEKIIEQIKR